MRMSKPSMKVAILCFGQFRSARRWFEPNLLQLKQAFPSTTEFTVHILTDKLAKGCYSQDTEIMLHSILEKHAFHLKGSHYWEDQTTAHRTEQLLVSSYENLAKGKAGYAYGNHFSPANWYRRYILYKLFEESKDPSTYVVFTRLFDTKLEFLRPLPPQSNTLYGCIDSFFMGPPNLMKQLFSFGAYTDSWQPFDWTPEFQKEFAEFDAVLASTTPTFCSEVQIYNYIKRSGIPWKSLRYDFSVPHGQSPSHETATVRSQVQRYKPIPEHICQIALGEAYRASLPLTQVKDTLLRFNQEYSYTLFTEHTALEFLESHFPQYLELYTSVTRVQYKSDLLRYLWLYVHGGYYIDIDTLPLLPLWTIYEKVENADCFAAIGAYTSSERNVYEVHNGFLASAPRNPIFLECVEQMKREPNPSDYGANVKFLWKTIQRRHSMTPYTNENAIYLFEEKEVQREKFCIVFHTEGIAIGNGMGYPPKQYATL
jgi:hypothetical protein